MQINPQKDLTSEQQMPVESTCRKIGKMLGAMLDHPEKFILTSDL
jgi:hypothetical protein